MDTYDPQEMLDELNSRADQTGKLDKNQLGPESNEPMTTDLQAEADELQSSESHDATKGAAPSEIAQETEPDEWFEGEPTAQSH